jgi:hypothetical protein
MLVFFQVSSKNKIDLVLAHVPFNLPILHFFEFFFFIPPWNRHVDNFIQSVVVFANKFLYDKQVVIMMHADDQCVFKDIHSFLES